ncbi:MAG: DUF3574 domain-containing protein [Pseudomonadota bacterium]
MSRTRTFVVLLALMLSSGCRSLTHAPVAASGSSPNPSPGIACVEGMRPMVRETLYFGRNRPDGGQVSDAAWRAFVDDVVAPHFPDGFTLVPAAGYWRSGTGAIVSEPSMLLIVLHVDDAASTASLGAIAKEYRRRFAQESVLRERGPTCVAF